jgi:putative transposase
MATIWFYAACLPVGTACVESKARFRQSLCGRRPSVGRGHRRPLWLRDPALAAIVVRALEQGENEYRLYDRFAWVVMPNHVHVVIQPFQPLPKVMRWIKGSTARSANLLLKRTGKPFWQYETYDHVIRDADELNRVIRYIERNPVRAGLASAIEDWPWSSAGLRG